jgi:hypothetical protein
MPQPVVGVLVVMRMGGSFGHGMGILSSVGFGTVQQAAEKSACARLLKKVQMPGGARRAE